MDAYILILSHVSAFVLGAVALVIWLDCQFWR